MHGREVLWREEGEVKNGKMPPLARQARAGAPKKQFAARARGILADAAGAAKRPID
ncbi:MAG TPA: hypothetical protein VM240_14315 [Verrucomicrobiae bacterium]|nr:hypothetical protein [Verrucomicrobiae bacterium]